MYQGIYTNSYVGNRHHVVDVIWMIPLHYEGKRFVHEFTRIYTNS